MADFLTCGQRGRRHELNLNSQRPHDINMTEAYINCVGNFWNRLQKIG